MLPTTRPLNPQTFIIFLRIQSQLLSPIIFSAHHSRMIINIGNLMKTEPDEDDDSVDEYDDDENDCRDCLIECPKSNCSKKFRDLEALKFHLSFAHNDLKRPKKPMESQIVPDEDSNLEECEMTPAEEIESKSCSNVEMPENVPKKLENGSQKTLPPMPLNTLPRQARLTSSTEITF
ncbi:unnamed protein product [Lepeophtheirus salmonis]|uniref:(salmon louse) hypothetical protein n=1 Tax=Lepeophtheirus salmonis TaxID=72036 RepID=A0A7R8CJ74_LEPSM|nr:unnamed protein product [Lepeophtheirus salmonis]CAF2839701.1 unnamed protein product [Lepeophtheirus salmonis]